MNSKYLIYVFAFLLAGIAIASVSGCDLYDVVQAKTPPGVQKTEGLPGKLSINDSRSEYEKWLNATQTDAATWRSNIESAEEIAGLFSNLTLSALDEAGPMIAGIPMGGALLPVIAGLVGVFLKRPGDVTQAQLRAEKEASFNSGLKKAAAIVSEPTA